MRNGSSPNVSSTRPQRRSRAMQSTGEKVQWTPVAATSTAVARATCSTSAGSHVAAMPSCVGKIVAPTQNEWPWMQSSASSRGMRSRVRPVSSCAARTFSGEVCSSEPACFSSTAGPTPSRASSWSIWPTFSGSVMRARRSSTRSATGTAGSR
ncbi:Uncharacterised protein [Mycobacteroides abscessus]|nr:Uncharacterised protein [Mycobacteroides abscessus]